MVLKFSKGNNMKKKKLYCPVCENKDVEKYWAMRGYRLTKCRTCGMVWDSFPPVDIEAQYDETYFINENPKGGYANYFEGMSVNRKTFSDRLKRIEKKCGKKGKLLDIGCALGDCLMEAKRLGWRDAEGIEISDYAYKFAKKRKLKVKKGALGKNLYPVNSFDIVMYQDVVEHTTNPVEELKKAFKVLKPGGMIYIVTPDIGGWWSKLLGPLWYHYKPGEHVVYFTQNTIKLALKKAGFSNIEIKRTYHILGLEYVFNRLRYYEPFFFGVLVKVSKKTPFRALPFRSYTGELEAWGQKIQ